MKITPTFCKICYVSMYHVNSVFYNWFFNLNKVANKQKLHVNNLAWIYFPLISKVTGIINKLFFPLSDIRMLSN